MTSLQKQALITLDWTNPAILAWFKARPHFIDQAESYLENKWDNIEIGTRERDTDQVVEGLIGIILDNLREGDGERDVDDEVSILMLIPENYEDFINMLMEIDEVDVERIMKMLRPNDLYAIYMIISHLNWGLSDNIWDFIREIDLLTSEAIKRMNVGITNAILWQIGGDVFEIEERAIRFSWNDFIEKLELEGRRDVIPYREILLEILNS